MRPMRDHVEGAPAQPPAGMLSLGATVDRVFEGLVTGGPELIGMALAGGGLVNQLTGLVGGAPALDGPAWGRLQEGLRRIGRLLDDVIIDVNGQGIRPAGRE